MPSVSWAGVFSFSLSTFKLEKVKLGGTRAPQPSLGMPWGRDVGWWSRRHVPARAVPQDAGCGHTACFGQRPCRGGQRRAAVEAAVTCSEDRRFKPPPKHSFRAWVCREEGSGVRVQECGAEGARGSGSRGGKGSGSSRCHPDTGEALGERLPGDLHLAAAQEERESSPGCVGTPGVETLPLVQPSEGPRGSRPKSQEQLDVGDCKTLRCGQEGPEGGGRAWGGGDFSLGGFCLPLSGRSSSRGLSGPAGCCRGKPAEPSDQTGSRAAVWAQESPQALSASPVVLPQPACLPALSEELITVMLMRQRR